MSAPHTTAPSRFSSCTLSRSQMQTHVHCWFSCQVGILTRASILHSPPAFLIQCVLAGRPVPSPHASANTVEVLCCWCACACARTYKGFMCPHCTVSLCAGTDGTGQAITPQLPSLLAAGWDIRLGHSLDLRGRGDATMALHSSSLPAPCMFGMHQRHHSSRWQQQEQ